MAESVALTQPAALTDQMGMVLDTLRARDARAWPRFVPMRTRERSHRKSDSAPRATLLPWLHHNPGRITAFLSPQIEIFWVGLESRPVDGALRHGVHPRARDWAACAFNCSIGVRGKASPAAGTWSSRQRLPNLDLSAGGASLRPADARPRASRHYRRRNGRLHRQRDEPGSRQSPRPGRFVQALGPDRVEEYLALLTTDGPLFPVGDSAAAAPGAGPARGWRVTMMGPRAS